jgi:GT2 family glycosyltransferase
MSNPRITALLVVHDGATWLPEVVASIASQSLAADQILAIDTGSNDASAKLLKGARIPTITLDRTTSFGKAISFGLSQLPPAIEGQEEWLWILHDDCSLDPHALEELLAAVEGRPNIAMAGPKLLGWHDRSHLLEAGISIATNGSRWTGLEPHEYDQGQRDGTHEVLSVSTAGALIRRDVFEELGGYDPNLELFRDDVDFGWRAHAAGYSVLAVTSAIGYHAQAASSERRAIDIEGAPLHRPLLLDRRNAAYVLLANSSWWRLPLLALQLLGGALVRSIAFLFAKLPGYASDEILAIASLLIHPGELLAARKSRRAQRLVSSSNVLQFIPSRWTQLRSGVSRTIENLRVRIFPDEIDESTSVLSDLEINEDEEILSPLPGNPWKSLLTRPFIIALAILAILTFGWTRHRLGGISGGALAVSPQGAGDLFKFFTESWHYVGMGSNIEAPIWTLILALASLVTLGNTALFISLFFIVAPFLSLWSAHTFLKHLTSSAALSAAGALLYALSPISISAINSGRLGVVLLLILLPVLITSLKLEEGNWEKIEDAPLRFLFAISLLLWVLAAFNPQLLIVIAIFTLFFIYRDFLALDKKYKERLFRIRAARRSILIGIPFLLLAPQSLSYIVHPTRMLMEIGIQEPGGGATLALLANPGGAGSLPWWSLSPVTLLLIVTYFSISSARKYATLGISFLFIGTIAGSILISGNGSANQGFVYSGTFLAFATFLAIVATVLMFDDVRSRLEQTKLNYQHFAVAFVLLVSLIYSATSSLWVISAGGNSPVYNNAAPILPAYLSVEEDAKSLVIRPLQTEADTSLAYYISRGSDVTLGEADVARDVDPTIAAAVEGLIDNTGVTSSKVLAAFGVKYVFVANPANQELIQTIDGIGGFARESSTEVGTVWKVIEPTGSVIFTDFSGKVTILDKELGVVDAPGAGTLTLTENYSSAWQAIASGIQLDRGKSDFGLPTFKVTQAEEVFFLHDGTKRRAWISIFVIAFVTTLIMALPGGRRRREMSDQELA